MPEDPNPIEPATQGTVEGYDGINDLMVSWDNGRTLHLIPTVDRYHIVDLHNPHEAGMAWSWLRAEQDVARTVGSTLSTVW